LEISILQQIIYSVSPNKIPNSHFKRILNISLWKKGITAFFITFWVLCLLLFWKNNYIEIVNPKNWFIDKSFDEIVEFAELGEFIDVPLKSFSSGMVARLGFAISTVVKPDILIVDEILSVGDFKFQEKSLNKIKSMMENGVTVLMVSHSIDQIEKMCNRVVWLENGSIKKIGLTKEICSEYKNS